MRCRIVFVKYQNNWKNCGGQVLNMPPPPPITGRVNFHIMLKEEKYIFYLTLMKMCTNFGTNLICLMNDILRIGWYIHKVPLGKIEVSYSLFEH